MTTTNTAHKSPEDMTNCQLLAIAPHIAKSKFQDPEDWETAYQSATDPLDEKMALQYSTEPPNAMSIETLASEMKKVKFMWVRLALFAKTEMVDPNPLVKNLMNNLKTTDFVEQNE